MIDYEQLHHVSLNVKNLTIAKNFYEKVLCMRVMDRPPLQSKGAWFQVGNSGQQLHLIEHPGQTLREAGMDSSDGHFAVRVSNYQGTINWLTQCGILYDARPMSATGFPQIYILDPDNNIIEFNTLPLKI